MNDDTIVEITSIKELMEMSSASGGASTGYAGAEKMKREDETLIREYIRKKIKKIRSSVLKEQYKREDELRKIVRTLLKEGDISDIHPHRSTAINILEDVLKKAIPTLRTDYKRMTTSDSQRKSFRAHVIKAVKDSLAPSLVNWQYLSGTGDNLLSEPVKGMDDEPEDEFDDLEDEFKELQEVEIDIDDDPESPGDEAKKLPVEDDDEPDEKEEFGSGLEEYDETGRNMAFTSFRKVSQYILDAFDTLADEKDKEVFVDYLITNLKLYFDKFESELQKSVDEPTSDAYEQNKK